MQWVLRPGAFGPDGSGASARTDGRSGQGGPV